MARMVLDQQVGFPAGQIAEALRRNFPDVRWQVGDGPQDGILPLDRPTSIFGRWDGAMVLLGIELVAGTLDDAEAPPHRFHVRLTGPSTEDRAMAKRLLAIVGLELARQGGGAMQFDEGEPWAGPEALAARAGPGGVATLDRGIETGPPSFPTPPASLVPSSTTQTFPRGSGTDRPPFGRKKI